MFNKIKDALNKFARIGVADKKAVDELVKDIQRTLIASDVNVKLVFELSKNIKEKALDEKIPKGLTRREHIIDIVYKELVRFLGEKKPDITLAKQKILLLGLYGSGKTTTTSKLAKYFTKKGLSCGMISCDVWRPAAFEQLKQLSEKINVEVYGEPSEKDPVKIVRNGLEVLKDKEIIIVDSAGRSALDDELRDELVEIDKILNPDEKLLVLSGDIGQAAGTQAKEFNELVGLTGVVITKMDSSAKGGGALSACYAAGVTTKFIGTGEKTEDFEIYDPVKFVSRLLGMGDLEGLLEKAKEVMSPEKAQEMMSGDFNLDTFYDQIEGMKKMGSMQKIMDMIPMGGVKIPKHLLNEQQGKMDKWKIIMDSMTAKEKKDPGLIDSQRIERVAKGAGVEATEVKELMKNYKQVSKMMKKFKGGKAFKRGPFKEMFKNMKGNMPV
ncbi:MAG: signal recognition particle protein [Candidatus Aenigmarchaeota archaeon]|nr:signal recognition particle protein [Candidatus Aenigmarchaeota archaeon]